MKITQARLLPSGQLEYTRTGSTHILLSRADTDALRAALLPQGGAPSARSAATGLESGPVLRMVPADEALGVLREVWPGPEWYRYATLEADPDANLRVAFRATAGLVGQIYVYTRPGSYFWQAGLLSRTIHGTELREVIDGARMLAEAEVRYTLGLCQAPEGAGPAGGSDLAVVFPPPVGAA